MVGVGSVLGFGSIGHYLKENWVKTREFVNSCLLSVEQAIIDNKVQPISFDRKYFSLSLS